MLIVTSAMITVLVSITQDLPIGTNLGMLYLLWALVSGQLLKSRGAIFPALQAIGLKAPAIRRAWAALRCGSWSIAELLASWQRSTSVSCGAPYKPNLLTNMPGFNPMRCRDFHHQELFLQMLPLSIQARLQLEQEPQGDLLQPRHSE